ncbi:MAG: glycosyltransferase family 39 protein [Aggregatilineales bacterium]
MKPLHILGLICLAALGLRLALLASIVDFPGIADPLHYYNMGVRLVEGHGFTIDYIWQYTLPPESIEHPEEHWMPLAAVLAAAPMALAGARPASAIVPFALLGALLPVASYAAARQMRLSAFAALFAATGAALLPEFVLNSLRTDTTIPAALFVSGSVIALTNGLRSGRAVAFAASGALGGLAYLTRNDGVLLLPMLAVTLLVYGAAARRYGPLPGTARAAPLAVALMPVVFMLVSAPWLARNWSEFGTLSTPETRAMFFFTHHNDHYAYNRDFTLATMLERQTPGEIIGKRLFEMAAGARLMITALDWLALPLIGGLLLLLAARPHAPDQRRELRERWLALAPALILLLGVYVAYALLIPYKAQAGSFKKAYLMLVPLLLPLAGYALDRAVDAARVRLGAAVLILALLGMNAFDLVRSDAAAARAYLASIERMAGVVRTLAGEDGPAASDPILMTQDPFILRYVGLRSVMFPFEDIDTIYEVALRYDVDYLLLPADRPDLDPIYLREAEDPRFPFAAEVSGTHYRLHRVLPPADPAPSPS